MIPSAANAQNSVAKLGSVAGEGPIDVPGVITSPSYTMLHSLNGGFENRGP